MRLVLCALIVVVALVAVQGVAWGDSINNWPRDSTVGVVDGNIFLYFGQTFVAPTFKLDDLTLDIWARRNDFNFHLLITETTGGTGSSLQPTTVLFESSTLTVDGIPSGTDESQSLVPVKIELGGLQLNAGSTYAFLLDAFVTYDDPGTGGATLGTRPLYDDGHFFVIGRGDNNRDKTRAEHFSGNVGNFLSNDLAFVFNADGPINPGPIPEPSTLALLGLGVAGLVVVRRRRGKQTR